MTVINYGYFLWGVVLLFAWRLFHLIPYFKRTPYPTPGTSSVWFFCLGSFYFLLLINMYQNIDLAYGFDLLVLLPTIIFILTIVNFWGESLITPSKNYLIALGFGALVGGITIWLFHLIFPTIGILSNYFELLPVLIGLIVGIIGGNILYYFLKSRYPDWNTPLCHLHKFWDVINHTSFLLVIAVLAFIEALFQWHSTSLVIILTS